MIKSVAGKILNILPHEWSRVSVAWLISIFARIGYISGWTVITALFVYQMGITKLPFLFISYAFFTILGTLIFSLFTHRLSKELNIIIPIILGSTMLFIANYFALKDTLIFFTVVIAGAAIFFAQLNIQISIFTEDLFSPLESQRTFPIIESAETIGGIIGGLLVVILVSIIPPHEILYIWIIILSAIIPIILIFNSGKQKVPVFEYNEAPKQSAITKVFEGLKEIKKTSFLKGLFIVVMLHWIFVAMLEFQYTKSLDQEILNQPEQTIVLHNDSQTIQTNVFSINKTVSTHTAKAHVSTPKMAYAEKLTEGLGKLHILFSLSALVIQLFAASRIIKNLGIIGSLLLHPLVAFLNTIGLTLRFGLITTIIAKTGYEITGVIHKNAYHSSYYALPHEKRAQTKEFLEGVGKPIGAIIGTTVLIILEGIYTGHYLTLSINIMMLFIITLMLVALFTIQAKYTFISKKQLLRTGEHPSKFQAIEILSQKGHKKGGEILINILHDPKESVRIKIKTLEALGRIRDKNTIPDIIETLESEKEPIKLAALEALSKFKNLQKHFFSQAFSRYRIINTLKQLFIKQKSADIKIATIKLLARLNETELVPFLLEILEKTTDKVRASCIDAMQEFDDVYSAYYLRPYLNDASPEVKIATCALMWNYKKFRPKVKKIIEKLKESKDEHDQAIAIRIIGEIEYKKYFNYLREMFESKSNTLKNAATLAMASISDHEGYNRIIEGKLKDKISYKNFEKFLKKLPPKIRERTNEEFKKAICKKIDDIHTKYSKQTLDKLDREVLKELKDYYEISGEYDETYRIENILNAK
ncbi:HEAT repeat domain-containing protein [Patescibacteria group bacterium]|nr:HEAT repeat domain-containing protein [Patescibacteria group bacterium]